MEETPVFTQTVVHKLLVKELQVKIHQHLIDLNVRRTRPAPP
jgi:hypothetical protein